ncbi:MAG: SDR family NAD(P)-dependent oxidoreductase [Dehalococcoidia bacterium]|nr:SDR family NAD(P)-dependent oxidoreductase [Dehalococcoidia bacterium]
MVERTADRRPEAGSRPEAVGARLKNRVAIVTGAGRGIGKEIAMGLAREGARVVAAARTEAEIESTAGAIASRGGEAIAVPVDVSNAAQVDAMARAALDRFGRIDVLVNNAGTFGPIGPLISNDSQAWVNTIMVNLVGTFLCTRAVLPGMVERRRGKIINLSGGGAASSRPNFTAYAASKAAIIRFTESVAKEVAEHNVQVNAMAPGPVFTRLTESILRAGEAAGTEALQEAYRQQRSGNPTLPDAVALAVFLASDESDGLSGRFISAVWDDWRSIPSQMRELASSDLYTLRRVVPAQARSEE